jgi:hypothetical protein
MSDSGSGSQPGDYIDQQMMQPGGPGDFHQELADAAVDASHSEVVQEAVSAAASAVTDTVTDAVRDTPTETIAEAVDPH